MPSPNYFLKMVGAADMPLEDRWVEQRPDLLYGVRTPRQPRAIKSGDLLVYYAAGAQKLIAISVTATAQAGEAVGRPAPEFGPTPQDGAASFSQAGNPASRARRDSRGG